MLHVQSSSLVAQIAIKGVECQPCELGHVPYLWKELEFCTPVKPGYYGDASPSSSRAYACANWSCVMSAGRAEKPYEYVKEEADMQQACPLMHACKGKTAQYVFDIYHVTHVIGRSAPPVRCASFEVSARAMLHLLHISLHFRHISSGDPGVSERSDPCQLRTKCSHHELAAQQADYQSTLSRYDLLLVKKVLVS